MLKSVRPSIVRAFLVCAFAAGCASPGHEKADNISSEMDDLRLAIVKLQQEVSAASASLGEIVDPGADPKAAYEHLDDSADELEDALERTDDRLASLRKKAQSYFEDWQKGTAAISDPDLQKLSEERRAKLDAALDEIEERMQHARGEVAAYAAFIKDLRTYLSADLSPAGIDSIRDKAETASKKVTSVNQNLDEVLQAVRAAAPMFATAKPPEKPK